MKFVDIDAARPMRRGDIRCWSDRILCWFFHARKYWQPFTLIVPNKPANCINCLKCDWKWYYEG